MPPRGRGFTKVDLRHLLEDLRDAYPAGLEETILTELVANSLDAGATVIKISAEPAGAMFRFEDDGRGMVWKELRQFHNLAASTKTRGDGIGFAGVGIKLALLAAHEVVTESRRGKSHAASRWHLASRELRRTNPSRRPVEFRRTEPPSRSRCSTASRRCSTPTSSSTWYARTTRRCWSRSSRRRSPRSTQAGSVSKSTAARSRRIAVRRSSAPSSRSASSDSASLRAGATWNATPCRFPNLCEASRSARTAK